MAPNQLTISSTVKEAFGSFVLNDWTFALPFTLQKNIVHALPAIHCKDSENSFQGNLNLLDDVLDPGISLYVVLRRQNSILAITFVPFRAPEDERKLYLRCRHDLVLLLGKEHVEMSLICKEIGEITDARSWIERDTFRRVNGEYESADLCENAPDLSREIKDAGYRKNMCRLCDRRMKNKITDEALAGLRALGNEGDCVQISLNADLVLVLDSQLSSIGPNQVSSHLPTTHPTFTLYRHPNKLLYFVFHSPDSATVQQRMKHTMAIPGLVNIHAEDCGAHVNQKIEIHEPEDLIFEEGDKKIGKFRSVYLRGGWQGTESQYERLDRDRKICDELN